MLALLHSRNFALIWFGQMVSQIGDMVLILALPFYVYQLTGSLLQTGLMYIVETLPRILFGSLAGVFVDRWDRRWTMIMADVGRAAVLMLLLLVARSEPPLAALCRRMRAIHDLTLFYSGADGAHADAGRQTAACRRQRIAICQRVVDALRRAAAGWCIAHACRDSRRHAGRQRLLHLSRRAMLLLIAMPMQHAAAVPPAAMSKLWAQVWRELFEGLRVIRERPLITTIFVTFSVFGFSQGLAAAPLIVFVREVMGGTALTMGWMAMAEGVGSLAGAFLMGRVSTFMEPKYFVSMPLVVAGCVVLLFVNIPVMTVVLPLIAVMGLIIVGFFVTTQTLIQSHVADAYRGRVAGALGTTTALMSLLGMLIASALGDRVGAVALMDSSGSLTALAGVIAMIMLHVEPSREHEHAQQDIPSQMQV